MDEMVGGCLAPRESVVWCTSDETVGAMLELVRSSHDSVFVANGKSEFLGLVSPYQVLYKRRFPLDTRVESCLLIPPHISVKENLGVAASYMLSTRVYSLPVFNSAELVGVVKADDIMEHLARNVEFLGKIAKLVVVRKARKIGSSARVGEAYSLLRKKGGSRLVVTDQSGKLVGILSRKDISKAFIRPSSRQRFSKKFGDSGMLMFDEEEIRRIDKPIESFMHTDVVLAEGDMDKGEIVRRMIVSGKRSIVLVDRDGKPEGFVSTRDILRAVAAGVNRPLFRLNIERPDRVSDATLGSIQQLVYKFGNKLEKRKKIERIDMSFKEVKSTLGAPLFFEAHMNVRFKSGGGLVGSAQSKKAIEATREVVRRVSKQERRSKND